MSVVRLPKYQQRKVHSAMAEQVDREKNQPQHLRRRLEHATEQNAQLQDQLADRDQLIEQLRQRIRTLEAARGSYPLPDKIRVVDGQHVITVQEAHDQIGGRVSIPTIYRYCDTGHWRSIISGGRRYILADQPLTIKSKPRRK